MILGDLLKLIKAKYDEVSSELEVYADIPEVERFLRLRGRALKDFQYEVSSYRLSEPVGIVLNSLRDKGVPYKIYGICSRKEEYFQITNKVRKAISKYEDELLRQAHEQKSRQEKLNFDKDFAIPDELTPEQFQEIYGE